MVVFDKSLIYKNISVKKTLKDDLYEIYDLSGEFYPGTLNLIVEDHTDHYFLKVLSGLNLDTIYTSGEILFGNDQRNLVAWSRNCLYMSESYWLSGDITTKEVIDYEYKFYFPDILDEERNILVYEVLKAAKLLPLMDHKCISLSSEDLTILGIMINLYKKPEIFLIDGYISFLTDSGLKHVLDVMKEFSRKEGIIIIMSVYKIDNCYLEYFDHMVMYSKDILLYQGEAKEIISYFQKAGVESSYKDSIIEQINEYVSNYRVYGNVTESYETLQKVIIKRFDKETEITKMEIDIEEVDKENMPEQNLNLELTEILTDKTCTRIEQEQNLYKNFTNRNVNNYVKSFNFQSLLIFLSRWLKMVLFNKVFVLKHAFYLGYFAYYCLKIFSSELVPIKNQLLTMESNAYAFLNFTESFYIALSIFSEYFFWFIGFSVICGSYIDMPQPIIMQEIEFSLYSPIVISVMNYAFSDILFHIYYSTFVFIIYTYFLNILDYKVSLYLAIFGYLIHFSYLLTYLFLQAVINQLILHLCAYASIVSNLYLIFSKYLGANGYRIVRYLSYMFLIFPITSLAAIRRTLLIDVLSYGCKSNLASPAPLYILIMSLGKEWMLEVFDNIPDYKIDSILKNNFGYMTSNMRDNIYKQHGIFQNTYITSSVVIASILIMSILFVIVSLKRHTVLRRLQLSK